MKEIFVAVLQHDNKILLLKRSNNQKYDPGLWEFVSGFIKNDGASLQDQVARRVMVETGVYGDIIKEGKAFEVNDEYGTWLIYPFLFSAPSSNIRLHTDHQEFKWIDIKDLPRFNCVKKLDKNLKSLNLL